MSDIIEMLPTSGDQPNASEYAKMRAYVKPYAPSSISYKTYILIAGLFLLFSLPFFDSLLGSLLGQMPKVVISLIKVVLFVSIFYVLNRYVVK